MTHHDTAEVESVAKGLTKAQRDLLLRHQGRRSSLCVPYCGTTSSPFWALAGAADAPPKYMTREALIARGLLERYDDAAGLTPFGTAVAATISKGSRHDD